MDIVARRAGEPTDAPFISSEPGPKTFVLASQVYDGEHRLAVLRTYHLSVDENAVTGPQPLSSQGRVETQTSLDASSLRRSIDSTRSDLGSIPSSLTVWQAARATSAAPTFFSPVRLGGGTFVDGGISVNNPTTEAITEVEHMVGPRGVNMVVSFGAGRIESSTQEAKETLTGRLKHSFFADTDTVHEHVSKVAERQGFSYFRFQGTASVGASSLWQLPTSRSPEKSELATEWLTEKESRICAQMLVASRRRRSQARVVFLKDHTNATRGLRSATTRTQSLIPETPEPTVVVASPQSSSSAADQAPTLTSLLHDAARKEVLRAIVNPKAYFTEIETLEETVLRLCDLTFLDLSDSATKADDTTIGPGALSEIQQRCIAAMAKALEAIEAMQRAHFCGTSIVVLAMDPARVDVVTATTLAIADVARFSESLRGALVDQALCVQCANELLHCFGGRFGRLPSLQEGTGSAHHFWTRMHRTCALLLLAIRSYSRSHRSGQAAAGSTGETDMIQFERHSGSNTGAALCFRREQLACLHDYLGGPVWVFGPQCEARPSYLAITLEQYSDLWGPLLAVPSSFDHNLLLGIRTQRGLLFISPRSGSDDPALEIPLRWQQMSYHETEEKLASIDAESNEHLWFPVDAAFLIGHPREPGQRAMSVEQRSTHSTLALSQPLAVRQGLRCNTKCSVSLSDFKNHHYAHIRLARTERERMKMDSIQGTISVPAAKFVVPAVGVTFKPVAGQNFKDILLFLCSTSSNNPEWLEGILNYRVGLEYSACSRNAQRITLLEALKLGFPSAASRLQDARDARKGAVIMPYLEILKDTGIDHRGRLQEMFSNDSGVPHIYEQGSDLPNWIAMLQDDLKNACFAVLSPRCLEFTERDKFRIFRSICARKTTYPGTLTAPVFSTKINIRAFVPKESDYDAASQSYSLTVGTRMTLVSGDSTPLGSVEIRSNPKDHRAGQMVYFSADSITHRTVLLLSQKFSGQVHGPNDEVVNMDLVSKYTITVFIVDQKHHAQHFNWKKG
ncbi:hypothetical protein LTR62_006263 [Meristemomyces frigidus]|uniref:PNPLA domain-containing protein n=1 Tax=Meristemomyces frigidus TaxID=1508187 RepID=A0AAN7TCL5_9PEZI|nr:hypothetical protein LTR62_006263 [Meristemomyces frigidus]